MIFLLFLYSNVWYTGGIIAIILLLNLIWLGVLYLISEVFDWITDYG